MRELPFNDYVTVQVASVTRDAIGAETLSWATHRAIWCRVGDVSIKEYLAADQQQAKRIVKVRCYATDVSDVTAKMRIVHGSRTLEIEGPHTNEYGDRTELRCWEITP
jgi:SPP1 family predicted phage head-tail adaptor